MSVRPPGGTLEKGLAPRRLLGVAGSNQEVRLVQLTTEPGNPGGRDLPRFGTMTAHGSLPDERPTWPEPNRRLDRHPGLADHSCETRTMWQKRTFSPRVMMNKYAVQATI